MTPAETEPASRPERAHHGGKCSVSIEASSPVVTAGETVTLLGRLDCPGATGVSDESLAIYEREPGDGDPGLSELATVTTVEDGSFQLTTGPLTRKSLFVVRSLTAHGSRTVVKVLPKVTIDGPAASGAELAARGDHASGLNRFTFTGTVSPAAPGTNVALQVEYLATGERWHTIALGALDDEGHYSITHGFRLPGELSVRVLTHPRGQIATSSEPLSYDVSQAQSAGLTIQTSSDPLSLGQSAMITGVAAGPAGQTVTLLARTDGHAFAPVAKARTEAGGAYSFTATPLQNTTYRVISASARSTALFQAVRYAVSAEAPTSTVQTGVPVIFSGTVVPAQAGQVVYLERRDSSGSGFHVVGVGTVQGSYAYSIAYTFELAGSDVMRVSVRASPQTIESASPEFTVPVTGAPAPA